MGIDPIRHETAWVAGCDNGYNPIDQGNVSVLLQDANLLSHVLIF